MRNRDDNNDDEFDNQDKKSRQIRRNKYGDIIDSSESWDFTEPSNNEKVNNLYPDYTADTTKSITTVNSMESQNQDQSQSQQKQEEQQSLEDNIHSYESLFPAPQNKSPNMKKKPSSLALGLSFCGAVGLSNVLMGGVVGAGFGAIEGLSFSIIYQLYRQPVTFRQVVYQTTVSRATNFAVWLGCYNGSRCCGIALRRKDDIVNSIVAGSMASMVASLKTRNPQTILASGFMGGIAVGVMELMFSK